MSKAHRGKGIRSEQNRGRGVCPVCNKTGVKVLYENEVGGEKLKICKICRANIKNKKAAEAPAEKPAEKSAEVPVEKPAEEPQAEITEA